MHSNLHLDKAGRLFRYILLAAVVATFLLIMMGYVVRFDGVEGACPDWPTCYGQVVLPADLAGRFEVAHRLFAAAAGLFVLVSFVLSFLNKAAAIIRTTLGLALAVMGLQVLLGGGLVMLPGHAAMSALHLGLALAAMGLVVGSAVAVFFQQRQPDVRLSLNFSAPFTRLTLVGLLVLFVLMVSGSLAASLGAGTACAGWPLCAGGLPDGALGWLSMGHRLITLAAAVISAVIFIKAWRGLKQNAFLLTAATGTGLLFAGQVFVGAMKVFRGYPPDLVGLHAATAAGLWGLMVALVVGAAVLRPVLADGKNPAGNRLPRLSVRLRAFLMLNKPIIVVLLLVTTYAGMVVGGREIPSLGLTFWTLLGGALAAGGASAINQYIDREIDGSMQRTAKRPLPAGLLAPGEALAYGVGACLAAFFLLAGFVNLLAAVLSFAGMVYYVLIYSIWLKHATVQNIVIGGGAGAIPPLVGWAAATGSLNVPSLFLFALVFMWTPPHFWALALVRAKDYARAGVPMLPVIKGEKQTRQQIFIYTLELVGLTLLMPVFNVAGSLFLVSAAVLGLWLISTAWRVLRGTGNKMAWRMYRYSSMYLAFIFLALVLDVLV